MSTSATDVSIQDDDGKTLAIAHDRGQITADMSNDRSSSVEITAVGWTDEEVVRLAQSLRLDSAGASFTDPSITAGYEMITTVQPWLTVQGLASEQIVAQASRGEDAVVGHLEALRSASRTSASRLASLGSSSGRR